MQLPVAIAQLEKFILFFGSPRSLRMTINKLAGVRGVNHAPKTFKLYSDILSHINSAF